MLKKCCLPLLLLLLVPLVWTQETDPKKLKQDEYWRRAENHPEIADAMHRYIEADHRLNALYQILLGIYDKAESDTVVLDKTALVKAQSAWLTYRDLTAKAENPGGTGYRFYQVMAELTQERTERIKTLLKYMSNGLSGKGPYCYEALAAEGLKKYEAMERSGKFHEPDPEKLNDEARQREN